MRGPGRPTIRGPPLYPPPPTPPLLRLSPGPVRGMRCDVRRGCPLWFFVFLLFFKTHAGPGVRVARFVFAPARLMGGRACYWLPSRMFAKFARVFGGHAAWVIRIHVAF